MADKAWKSGGRLLIGIALGILSLPFPVIGTGMMIQHLQDGKYVAIPLLGFLIGISISGLAAAGRLVFERSHAPATLFGPFFFGFVVIAFFSVAVFFFAAEWHANGIFSLLVSLTAGVELVRRYRGSIREVELGKPLMNSNTDRI